MAVLPSEVKYYQSLETDSLGGGISTFTVPTGLNLWYSGIEEQEATDGSTAYRCMYIKNESGTDTLTGAEIYKAVLTPSPSTSVELGLGSSGLNGIEQTITSENIAPVGVTFFSAVDASPLVIGDLGPGEHYPIWVKRICLPNAVGTSNDSVIFGVRGDGGAP